MGLISGIAGRLLGGRGSSPARPGRHTVPTGPGSPGESLVPTGPGRQGRPGAAKAGATPSVFALPWQVGRALGASTASGLALSSLPRHYSGWVYAAVRAIAQGAAACAVRFRIKLADGSSPPLPERHPLVRLFEEVNPFHTYRELVETTLTDLELTGNAFWLMSRRKVSGVPGEIWPVPPAWMRVCPGEAELVREYRLRRAGREVRLDPRDVVHFRYPNPRPGDFTGLLWGYAPLEAALEAVRADESIARAQRRSFENGPLPGALLRTRDPLTREQQERFRALFDSAHAGPDAAGRLLITDGEAEITPFTTSPREMDFVDSARSVRDRILGVFGVPPAVLGIVEDFNRANARAAQEIFARETLLPKLALVAQRVTQDVCSQFLPAGLVCEFASPVPADREAARKDMEAGVRLGVLSANEARADFYGKPPLEGSEYDRPRPTPSSARPGAGEGIGGQSHEDQAHEDQGRGEQGQGDQAHD